MRTDEALRSHIREFPGNDGWWHRDGEDTYVKLGSRLVDAGFTVDDAVGLLGTAYSAAAGEFGA